MRIMKNDINQRNIRNAWWFYCSDFKAYLKERNRRRINRKSSQFKKELNDLLEKYGLEIKAVNDQWNDIDVDFVDKDYNCYHTVHCER